MQPTIDPFPQGEQAQRQLPASVRVTYMMNGKEMFHVLDRRK
jgi:hypothetical protein